MRCMGFECDDDTPVGTLVYGSGSYAYIVVAGEHGPSLEAFHWDTDADRNPLPGEFQRVLAEARSVVLEYWEILRVRRFVAIQKCDLKGSDIDAYHSSECRRCEALQLLGVSDPRRGT